MENHQGRGWILGISGQGKARGLCFLGVLLGGDFSPLLVPGFFLVGAVRENVSEAPHFPSSRSRQQQNPHPNLLTT